MTFLLRRVATTADGREIVRATPSDLASLTVGRDAASDIHLPDLALNPAHARITMLGSRQIEVEALSSLGFDVDGRTTTKATIDAGEGAELRFGGHRITVGMEEGAALEGAPPRITLTIARTDELSHSALDRDEAQAFSLRGMLPGRRSSAWVFSLFVLAAFLAAPIYAWMSWRGVEERPVHGIYADASWSSGPLSSAHASLANDCQSCHVDAFTSVTDASCKSCHSDAHDHAPAARQIAARGDPGWFRAGLIRVGERFGRPQGRCVECHTEHEGAGPMPSTAQQFCADCHDGMSSRLTDTAIGDAGDFGTSHPQFRPAVQIEPGGFDGSPPTFRRVTLTNATTDDSGLKFPHDVHLQRAGGVAR
jgi:predicted CXXCH cytochrome family protein